MCVTCRRKRNWKICPGFCAALYISIIWRINEKNTCEGSLVAPAGQQILVICRRCLRFLFGRSRLAPTRCDVCFDYCRSICCCLTSSFHAATVTGCAPLFGCWLTSCLVLLPPLSDFPPRACCSWKSAAASQEWSCLCLGYKLLNSKTYIFSLRPTFSDSEGQVE